MLNENKYELKRVHFRMSRALYDEITKKKLWHMFDEHLCSLIVKYMIGDGEQ